MCELLRIHTHARIWIRLFIYLFLLLCSSCNWNDCMNPTNMKKKIFYYKIHLYTTDYTIAEYQLQSMTKFVIFFQVLFLFCSFMYGYARYCRNFDCFAFKIRLLNIRALGSTFQKLYVEMWMTQIHTHTHTCILWSARAYIRKFINIFIGSLSFSPITPNGSDSDNLNETSTFFLCLTISNEMKWMI